MKKYFFAGATVLIWSTLAAMVKVLLGDMPNLQMLAISGVFAFAFLLILNLENGSVKLMKQYSVKDYAKMAGLGFLGLFIYSALYYYGIGQLTSQQACILNYLWPIMLVIFSCIILREKMTVMKGVAMACSFIGIIILTMGMDATQSSGNVVAGVASCIIAAACYGLFSVLNKKANYNQNIAMMIIWLTTAVCSAVLGVCTEQWVPIRGVQWLGLIWLGVVVDAIAYLLWALALNDAKNTATIANLAYLTPFLSLIVSAVVVKEKVDFTAVVALVFIIGGILMQSVFAAKKVA